MNPGDTVMIENLSDKFTLGTLVSTKGSVSKVETPEKTLSVFSGLVRPLPQRKPSLAVGQTVVPHGKIMSIQWNGNEYEYQFTGNNRTFWIDECSV